ncbi:ribonuclease HIII [Enterococcus sp. PF1-24]|uniref:ribonuclease HIII n=1 Tax=unclassified Enterococcus TaxID=2608891 RepID=UPI002474E681|nr:MULTISPECIES: ribonuclease HIII [unclassified Enterococcus]MDH6364569.1 ribonuclease HIII [Enterococcus sp. PFB1-1]MDH6401670.1 ribonuclease HIII [Enterococcus sp. PF1-24]
MTNIVLKPNQKTYQEILNYYQKFRLNKSVPYTALVAKKNNVNIAIYTSGKVMFQGNQAETEAEKWQAATSSAAKSTKQSAALPANFANLSVVGSDEVGNGSYFGPLIVCAAYAPREKLATLKKLGVRDSKELTDKQIKEIAVVLEKEISYKLLTVTPAKYNQIQPKYNAVHMKAVLHNQAIFLLLQAIQPEKPEAILIDQFTPEKNYRKYIAQEKNQVPGKIYFATKGEQYHLAVAAASILCRAAFLNELAKASKELGFTVPSGAGATADQVAAKVLKIGGQELLQQHVKLHFANTEKARKILANQK